MRSAKGRGSGNGKYGGQSRHANLLAIFTCSHWGVWDSVCETQSVCVWVACVYVYLLFIQKLCATLAHATAALSSIRASCSSRNRSRRQPNIAKLLPARPLPCPVPLSPVCLSAPCCMQCICHSVNCFCGLHCKFATLSARVQQLATFKCVSKMPYPLPSPFLTYEGKNKLL